VVQEEVLVENVERRRPAFVSPTPRRIDPANIVQSESLSLR
jgi:hypothetical protein